jgi:hypothetical protein|tara:strand:+ start:13 stop:762 length:750 start_codon:yes stop_codon:yes gene_type:complete
MKKSLFLLVALCSAFTYAQESYKHQPVANKAEYYVASFNARKDVGDLIEWAADFEAWQTKSGVWDSMSTSLLMPYYINNTALHDVVWLNIWPSSTEQYIGNEDWVTRGGELMKKLPVTNSQVVDTWQWSISAPEGEGSIGMVSYSDCKLEEGVSGRQAFSALKDYAIAAREKGDNLGRKMIFPSAGGTEGDYDYVYAKYSNTISEFGANEDLYWSAINGSDEDLALNEIIESCSNYRTYTSTNIIAANN